jgi:hypothetical protein
MASAGNGSPSHTVGELFKMMTGVRLSSDRYQFDATATDVKSDGWQDFHRNGALTRPTGRACNWTKSRFRCCWQPPWLNVRG